MTIDWQKEVEARKEDLLEDLKNLYVSTASAMTQK